MFTKPLPEPWLGFLADLDKRLPEPMTLLCMGGFVMTHCYGCPRSTVDIDTCGLAPLGQSRALGELAGRGSELHKKHRVYLEHVTVNTVPCDHEERAILIDTPGLENLTLLALEAHDLALSKLERSQDRDIADVQYLARQGHINAHQLQERYFEHQRPYMVGDLRRYDFCFNLWLNLCWPEEFPG